VLTDYVQTLYVHAAWGNRRVLDSAARLTDTSLLVERFGGVESVLHTLIHILNAERTWIARAQLQVPPADLHVEQLSTVSLLREVWNDVDTVTQDFVMSLDEHSLGQSVRYLNPEEQPQAYPRWQVLVHQAMHAAQHRSEVALVLTQLGYSPGWLDFLFYLDIQDGP